MLQNVTSDDLHKHEDIQNELENFLVSVDPKISSRAFGMRESMS